MTREERLRILGPECVAEMRRQAAAAPAPSRELVAELRRMFAPIVAELTSAGGQGQPQTTRARTAA